MSQPPDPIETGVTFALGPWQEVAPNVFRAVAEPESVNLGLVVGSERAIAGQADQDQYEPGPGRAAAYGHPDHHEQQEDVDRR